MSAIAPFIHSLMETRAAQLSALGSSLCARLLLPASYCSPSLPVSGDYPDLHMSFLTSHQAGWEKGTNG